MSQTDPLSQHLKATPRIISSVLTTFDLILVYIAVIEDLLHDKTKRLSTEWGDFYVRFVIMMWDSRNICIGARSQLVKLNDLLKFAMKDPPNLEVIKAKVRDYLNVSFVVVLENKTMHCEHCQSYNTDPRPNCEKIQRTRDQIAADRYDDGTSNYSTMVKALNDLKERLPPEDQTDMKSVWHSDTLHPIPDRFVQIEKAWLEVWYEAQLVTEEIKAAPDVATIKMLRLTIERAFSDYESLSAACEIYEHELHRYLYPAYKEIIERRK